MRKPIVAALAVAAALPPTAEGVPPTPIPQDPMPDPVTAFAGAPATPRRIDSFAIPRHPFMAPNGRSNLHDDAYQTDSYAVGGPLGRDIEVSSTLLEGVCASVTFDSQGRIVTICVGLEGPKLALLHPRTLELLAAMPLPPRMPGGGSIFNDFAGGGYFYLDHRDRAVTPTTNRHIYVVAVRDGPSFVRERDYDLTSVVPAGDKIISALPDWSGRIWFASIEGVVGTVDPASGRIRSRDLGEEIANSFAVDESGAVYIVTRRALYRFDAAPDGTPAVSWREVYRNSGISKPGQVHAGSGTTPTVVGRSYVAITDNADPMNVVVYRRARQAVGPRRVCEQPVFRKGASATDQSLIAAGSSLIAENNYGFGGFVSTMDGRTTTPGIERVDVLPRGRGCRTAWRSAEIAPSVVPKLSLANGLVYTYTKPPRSDDTDAWYFTALDFCSGRTVYRRLAGTGFGHDNNYAPVTLGPDGTAYVGAVGGLISFRDTRPPPSGATPRGCASRPRLALRLRYRKGCAAGRAGCLPNGRRGRTRAGVPCARGRVRATVVGRDRALIRRAAFFLGRRHVANDPRAPFSRVVDRGRHRGRSHFHRVRVRVLLRDGRRVTLRRRYRVCGA